MKILITGATGFIGSHLIDYLSKYNHHLYCIVRNTSVNTTIKKLEKRGVKIIIKDLKEVNKSNLPKDIDWIFHIAALVDVSEKYSLKRLYRENVVTTKKLAEYYLKRGIKKFVYLSSMSVIGEYDSLKKVNEDIICKPKSAYGKSKLEAEQYLLGLYKKNGFPVVIIRPPTVYGPGEHYNFRKLTGAIYKKRYWLIGTGKNILSLCYVGNLVKAALLAAKEKKAEGEIFFIDDGRSYTQKETAEQIAKASGLKLPAFRIPYWLAMSAGYFFEQIGKLFPFEAPLTRRRVKTLTSSLAFDITKARKVLNYQPNDNLSNKIQETIEAYRKDGFLK